MKPVAFDYARPRTIDDAVRMLAASPNAKVLAGGQTLGPMLNLRLARPSLLVDITRITELARVEDSPDDVTLGAIVTHAAIEDGRAPDPSRGYMRRVASGIAYRAVRTRGTVGGSLAHADPAADWLTCLTALGAEVAIVGSSGRRHLALAEFVRGPLDTDLAADELIAAVRIPKLSPGARCGYHKICRKTGEFAEAIGAVVHDPERGVHRLVAGSTQGRPILLEGTEADLAPAGAGMTARLAERLQQAGLDEDAYELNIHVAALRRAMQETLAA